MYQYQIEANEDFFKHILSVLNEGGKWVWKNYPNTIFTKKDGKLEGDSSSYEMVSNIVSPKFLQNNFTKK